jgi:hypothetical protein
VKRRRKPVEAGEMPERLRRHPHTPEAIARWVGPDERAPDYWGFGEAMWRLVTAHSRWSRARHEWRARHDPNYWWYRKRGER